MERICVTVLAMLIISWFIPNNRRFMRKKVFFFLEIKLITPCTDRNKKKKQRVLYVVMYGTFIKLKKKLKTVLNERE